MSSSAKSILARKTFERFSSNVSDMSYTGAFKPTTTHGGGGRSFARVDPIDPTEPTEPPAPETYSDAPHPILGPNSALSKAIEAGISLDRSLTDALSSSKSIKQDYFNSNASSGYSAKPVIYSDWSPASKLFGMSQETAFSEHLANTAHQREIADLKAAGLNPVLGISGSGSSTVSGNAAFGSSSAHKEESFPWLDVLGATAGLVTTVVTKKPALGYMVANVFKAFE